MENDAERRRKKAAYMREYSRRRKEQDPDYAAHLKARQKAYYEAHGDSIRARAAAWYVDNHAKALEASKARYDALPKKGRPQGEAHVHWKGEGVGYGALHRWVVRHKGSPTKCEHCGTETARKYEWANVDHKYRRVLDDWLRLCTSCHRKHDYVNGLAKKGGRRRKDLNAPDT